MQTFDETYADRDFREQLERSLAGWSQLPAGTTPDLTVDGLRGSVITRFLDALFRRRDSH